MGRGFQVSIPLAAEVLLVSETVPEAALEGPKTLERNGRPQGGILVADDVFRHGLPNHGCPRGPLVFCNTIQGAQGTFRQVHDRSFHEVTLAVMTNDVNL
jgi:hypothetical protein